MCGRGLVTWFLHVLPSPPHKASWPHRNSIFWSHNSSALLRTPLSPLPLGLHTLCGLLHSWLRPQPRLLLCVLPVPLRFPCRSLFLGIGQHAPQPLWSRKVGHS